MSPSEMAWRARDTAWHAAWARRQVHPRDLSILTEDRHGASIASLLPRGTSDRIPEDAKRSLISQADRIVSGQLSILGVERPDIQEPDWFYDPVTGRQAPNETYAFRIPHRSEEITGNVKQLWELSRLQHLPLLSAAWYVTGDEKYARVVDKQLRSWWNSNPFLSGVHWTSGIEVGLRLISFTWIRRLLDGWAGTTALFEDNEVAVAQIRWHQEYLARFRSRGSSANNHVIAEAAGQLVASCAFPWFSKSDSWRVESADLLERELGSNTFASGLNREQASEYHEFVAELGLLGAIEADACGRPVSERTWELLSRMINAAAAVLDSSLRPPRQGDGDDGRALVVDGPEIERSEILLATGAAIFEPAPWWPKVEPGVMSTLVASLASDHSSSKHSVSLRKPSHFSDAGMTLLRTQEGFEPEIWCRCDGGPHGFLSIAGHAHADALSVEVRHDGVGILIDPGTYCYHGEPEFRRYFRSTLAHNTIEIAGADQSESGGPFMWLRHAQTTGIEVEYDEGCSIKTWSAQHNGYQSLDHPVTHRRVVRLDAAARRIEIEDMIRTEGRHPAKMAFHLGPDVSCRLDRNIGTLSWRTDTGDITKAIIELPGAPRWTTHTGETDPVLGWYSSSFGVLEPTTVLVGNFEAGPIETRLFTRLTFGPGEKAQFLAKVS